MRIEFIRVSPIPISSAETGSRIVDRSYHSLSEQQMADLYREADIFISSSLEGEGFGLPAIEAMSCGTPCVLTEIRSYQNFDRIRNFAFFVPTHQPLKIAEAVKEIVYDRTLRGNLIKRGFEIAEKFSLENTAKRLLKVIHEIILNEGERKCRVS